MNQRKSLLMIVILLILGGYIYLVESPREQKAAEEKKLVTLDKDAIVEIALTYPDRAVTLKKTDGKWRIIQPVEADADESTVNNLITAVIDAEVKRTLDEVPQDLTVYGLNAPRVKMKLVLKDGKPLPLVSLGKNTPVGSSVYAQKEGMQKILLLPQTLRTELAKEVKDLRDRTILTFSDDEVRKIAIRAADSEIVLQKADSGWKLEKPISAKADDMEVRTFLSNLRSIRAQDFLEDPTLEPKEFGLAPPQLEVTLTIGTDNAQKTIQLGNEKTNDNGGKTRYLKRVGLEKPLFLVGDSVLRDVGKTATDFRDKTVAQFTQEQAAKVEVKRQDGEAFTLTRGPDNKWTIDKTAEGTLREPALSQFVADLRELRGFEIVADNPTDLSHYGLDQPVVTIAISDKDGKKFATILTGQKTEGETKKVFAMAEGGQTVFGLRDHVFDRLNKKPAEFWEKPNDKKEASAPAPAPSMGEPAKQNEESAQE
ncbi:MAG: DUF4340 domain-containing protein [Deltaproteobacteria bacterium]|nr:DUF4340 domain-containing protein [Deltaproteobacteria bacterium]